MAQAAGNLITPEHAGKYIIKCIILCDFGFRMGVYVYTMKVSINYTRK